jgi:hypothetical protein
MPEPATDPAPADVTMPGRPSLPDIECPTVRRSIVAVLFSMIVEPDQWESNDRDRAEGQCRIRTEWGL